MDHDKTITLSENELESIIEKAAERGVENYFTRMGIDISNPVEMQKDFNHLREWRQATHAIQKRGMLVLVSVLIAGGCAAFWMGFKGMVQ